MLLLNKLDMYSPNQIGIAAFLLKLNVGRGLYVARQVNTNILGLISLAVY